MDLRQLRYLIALARERHFTRAADACAVTQPTLSARLRQPEEDLGVAIIKRGHRYHGLTPEGETVLAWARRIVDDCDRMFEDLAASQGVPQGVLTLGVIPSALPMAARLALAVQELAPGIRMTLRSRSLSEIDRDLEAFEIDAAITYLPEGEAHGRIARTLRVERYALFIAADHALAGHETVTWTEAAQHPLCALTSDMRNRKIVDDAFAAVGQAHDPVVESNSIVALCTLVRGGRLGCVLPSHFLELFGGGEGVRAVAMTEPEIGHAVGLIALDRQPTPPLVSALFVAADRLR